MIALDRPAAVSSLTEEATGPAASALLGGGIVYGRLALAVGALAIDQVGFLLGAGRVGGIGAIDVVLTDLVGEPGSGGELDQFAGQFGVGAGRGDYWLLAGLVLAGVVEQVLEVLVLSGVLVLQIDQVVSATGIGSQLGDIVLDLLQFGFDIGDVATHIA